MLNHLIKTPTLSSHLLQSCVPLADKNWFATGGNARFFAEPKNSDDFAWCLTFAQEYKLPVFMLGQGANVLISDAGFDGLVIRPSLNMISHAHIDDNFAHVTAGSGTSMHDLINYCLEHQLVGLEEFSGIPGTVGGSVYINLHYFEFLLSQFLVSGRIIHSLNGTIEYVDNAWFKFGYNDSMLQKEPYYLLDATFLLRKVSPLDAAYARGRRDEIIRHRVKRYPNKGTCGSFFRNFHEHEVSHESGGKKMIYVAYYLDKIGAKGTLSVGDAIVSFQHANMIVNKGTATSQNIIDLARLMQEKVLKQFGFVPQPECKLVGFKEYPLL